MDESSPNYRREFLRSPQHAWFGLLTVGVGFLASAFFQPLYLLLGATAYGLGWIHLPDTRWFRRRVDARLAQSRQHAAGVQLADFTRQRDALLISLSDRLREKYADLAGICHDIEAATADSPADPGANLTSDTRLRKLDELMWMYLRLLTIEQSIEVFLETERREELPRVVQEATAEVAALAQELDAAKRAGGGPGFESKQRLLGSRQDRLEVLEKRLLRTQQTQSNLALVRSEQDRLIDQIKLIRADAIATKNADALTARIDASVEHLNETSKWLSEMSDFKDLVNELPATPQRLGFDPTPAPPPPLPTPARTGSGRRPT